MYKGTSVQREPYGVPRSYLVVQHFLFESLFEKDLSDQLNAQTHLSSPLRLCMRTFLLPPSSTRTIMRDRTSSRPQRGTTSTTDTKGSAQMEFSGVTGTDGTNVDVHGPGSVLELPTYLSLGI